MRLTHLFLLLALTVATGYGGEILRNAEKKWKAAPIHWRRIRAQLAIFFPDRFHP